MIPRGLTNTHFLKAAKQIDKNGIPTNRRSVHYDLVLNGKKYPPKYVISLAELHAHGKEYPASKFNAIEARNYFLSNGYTVIDRRKDLLLVVVDEDDESRFPEGKSKYSRHRRLERDSTISRSAKAKRMSDTGKLECEVCGADFVKIYGDIGKGFIEAHHTTPVSELEGRSTTRISDIALVCSNCHRMLHRGKPLLTIPELQRIVLSNTKV